MWAMTDPAKARLLVERGADVNAVSRSGRSPLIIAAAQPGAVPLVSFLLEKGAKAAPEQSGLLAQAAGMSSDAAMLRLLYPRVLDPKGPAAAQSAGDAAQRNCWDCLDYLLQQGVRGPQLGPALVFAANNGDAAMVRKLLQAGAPTDVRVLQGSTALHAAATSEIEGPEKVRILLEAGAGPNTAANDGRTPLSYARDRHPEIAPLLIAKGAK
jgi:ankyrin repeat protein